MKRRIDYSLNKTVHSSFSLMGHFSKFLRTKDILEGSSGTLNYHDGVAEECNMTLSVENKFAKKVRDMADY